MTVYHGHDFGTLTTFTLAHTVPPFFAAAKGASMKASRTSRRRCRSAPIAGSDDDRFGTTDSRRADRPMVRQSGAPRGRRSEQIDALSKVCRGHLSVVQVLGLGDREPPTVHHSGLVAVEACTPVKQRPRPPSSSPRGGWRGSTHAVPPTPGFGDFVATISAAKLRTDEQAAQVCEPSFLWLLDYPASPLYGSG